ncbi:helix-turn-helix domain-containing protein [Pseudomonas sp. Pseusp122]|uniref:helix-turn-helix domain-containing protein n=1 Tax=unclassified Pseudomonas TaxID=196821 RepID=UPI0039A53733
MNTIGERLKLERQRLGLSQDEFSALGGVAANAQRLYESGHRIPRADYLSGISSAGADVLYVVLGIRMPKCIGDLPDAEISLITAFRTLPCDDQNAISRISSSLSNFI